jgi:precorrin-2 dehydrogenase/sirohydrochlorin ferrochelatase
LLVDLNLSGRDILVIADQEEARTRAKQLRYEGANVTVLPIRATNREKLDQIATVPERLLENLENREWKITMKKRAPFLTVISSGNLKIDQHIANYARSFSRLVYVVDRPELNDLNMAGIAKIGDIRVAISTRGLSPAMAGLLRRKIESQISREDVLQVKLQGQMREAIKRSIKNPPQRKEMIYKLIRNKKILSLLRSDNFEEAKRYALSLIADAKAPKIEYDENNSRSAKSVM